MASLDEWLGPLEDTLNHNIWLSLKRRESVQSDEEPSFLFNVGPDDSPMEQEEESFEDEELAAGNQGDLERFFTRGRAGFDTSLTSGPPVVSSSSPLPPPPSSLSAKEARPDKQDVLTFHWGDEELNLNGNDSDEDYTFLGSDEHGLLSSGFFPSFDSAACNDGSLMDIGSSVSSSPSAHLPLSLPSPASTLNGSHPLSPAPSSSPVPSSPPSLLSVAPAEAFFQQHSQPPSAEAKRKTPSGRSSAVTESMATKVQSAPTTPSSLRTAKARRGGGKKPPKGGDDSKALRPHRRRAASTIATQKQNRQATSGDKANPVITGPLTLEKLASLSALRVSVLQKQLKMVNASTKGSKAQLIQRLVRYLYLFSQHRHQAHPLFHSGPLSADREGHGCQCIDPTLINAESIPTKLEPQQSGATGPSSSWASSKFVFPLPLSIKLTGRIVEDEDEDEFSD